MVQKVVQWFYVKFTTVSAVEIDCKNVPRKLGTQQKRKNNRIYAISGSFQVKFP